MKSGKLLAIDLFCGAGGFTLAAKKIGINILSAIEYDKYACSTYRNNFIKFKRKNKPKLYEDDILGFEPSTILNDFNLKQGQLDILMGGPPCQGFSTLRIKNAGIKDPRNLLLERYFDFIKILKPKTFIVENVSGLLWPRHEKHLNQFYRLARKSDYKVFAPVLLNAKDYGVPQNRKRVFILGHRKDLNLNFDWPPKPTHFAPEKDAQKNSKLYWLPSSVVFEKPVDKDDPNNIHMNHSKELLEVFKSTPKNGGSRAQSKRQLPCHKNHNGHKDVYGRIDPKKPGPTITTGCVNPSRGRFLHPTENHGITIRHAARFQTFPDNFIFSGGLMTSAVQVGNAVPIKLGQKVLQTIIKSIGG